MLEPALEDVKKSLENTNRVPVYKQYTCDSITPVSAYLSLSKNTTQKGFLLESVERGEQIARYSFLGVEPRAELWLEGDDLKSTGSITIPDYDSPFRALQELISDWSLDAPEQLPGFTGGLVGYMGYEMIRYIEPTVPVKPWAPNHLPDFYFYLAEKMVIFDHVKRYVYVVGHVSRSRSESIENQYRRLNSELEDWGKRLLNPADAPDLKHTHTPIKDRLSSNFDRSEFEQSVRSIKDDIHTGEIFQAVLSQRFELEDPNHPFNLYRRLRSVNPSPYMFYLDFDEFSLIGASPEILVQKEGPTVRVRPIAGTRRRGETSREDRELAEELQADEKEQAEHTMLVDLGRNDLGRISKPGSVDVTDRAYIERYSHVMHMVSNVDGTIMDDKDAIDALKATFPAGTVTGAPKVRAMQIIESLEPNRRGPYAGCVGYVSFEGNLDTCIVIRTILARDDTLQIQAGAGIVADSEPSREYEETREKANALLEAIDTLPDTNFL